MTETEPRAHPRIVVGIDGSETSRRALHWAVTEAERRGGVVEAVHVWHFPTAAYSPFLPPMAHPDELERDAHALLDRVVAPEEGAAGAVPIQRIVLSGGIAESLLQVAKGADLLVVGTRGLGGFTGLLLGSVSHQVVHHAPCPVVVIPEHDR